MMESSLPTRISEIREGMRGLTVVGKIVQISEERMVTTRFGPARVATALLEDDSGSIRLNLWRDQINTVKQGDTVRLENAFVRVFNSQNELNIGRDGAITAMDQS